MSGRTVFFDTETTGVDRKNDHIIQLAAIAVDDETGEEIETFERKLTFDYDQPGYQKALAMNSFDREVWEEEAVAPIGAMTAFTGFLQMHSTLDLVSAKGRPYRVANIAAYNASFDCEMLQGLNNRACNGGFIPADIYRPMDVMQLAIWALRGTGRHPKSYRLGDVAEFIGVSVDGELHDALVDVRLTVAVAASLMIPLTAFAEQGMS